MTFGLTGAALTALCCFTPILTGLLGLVGLGAVTGYLDYVLLPALAGFLGLAVYGLLGRNRQARSICCHGKE
jgi:mercuric ion transport protein